MWDCKELIVSICLIYQDTLNSMYTCLCSSPYGFISLGCLQDGNLIKVQCADVCSLNWADLLYQ